MQRGNLTSVAINLVEIDLRRVIPLPAQSCVALLDIYSKLGVSLAPMI